MRTARSFLAGGVVLGGILVAGFFHPLIANLIFTETKLTPSDPASLLFGQSVAISGDTLAVATCGDDQGVYVFVWSDGDWVEQAKLTPSEDAFSF